MLVRLVYYFSCSYYTRTSCAWATGATWAQRPKIMNGREWRKEIFYSCSESFAKTKRVHEEKWKEIKIDQSQVKCIAAILKLPLFFHEPKFSAFIKLKQQNPPRFIYYSWSKFWFIFCSWIFRILLSWDIFGLFGFIYTQSL